MAQHCKNLNRLTQLKERDTNTVQTVLREFATHQGYGKYDLELVYETLQTSNQTGYFGTMGLETNLRDLKRLRSIVPAVLEKSSKDLPFWKRVKSALRYHLDIIDGFRRVRETDILNRALVAQKVGLRRAAMGSSNH